MPSGSPALPRTLLLALIVCTLALVWFQAVALLVDRLGRRLRRPRAARGLQAGTGAALTALGAALLIEAPGLSRGQPTRPYQTPLVQILSSFTTSPVFGACQIFP